MYGKSVWRAGLVSLALLYGGTAGAQWFEDLVITQIQTFPEDGKFAIYVESGLAQACSGGIAAYVESGQASMTPGGAKNALSVALAALTSGNRVNISIPSVQSPCYVDRMRIER